MKKMAFTEFFALPLIIAMLISLVAVFAFKSSAEDLPIKQADTPYAESDGWLSSNPNPPTDYAYSMAIVGDTQTLLIRDLTNGTSHLANMYDWLVDNAQSKKISYVIGLGDICANDTDAEWVYAKECITSLDGIIPYILNRGNSPHDTNAQLNKYFASYEKYTDTLDGTLKSGEVQNSYTIFTAGETKYLVLALDYNPSDAVLEWANEVCANNKDCQVIISTHAYLYSDGTLQGEGDGTVPSTNNGEDMWDKLVRKHANIKLVLSGHNPSTDVVYRQDVGDNGNIVTSMLIDPQNMDAQAREQTIDGVKYKVQYPKGMMCMLYFSADGSVVDVEWFSTVSNQYYKAVNQYSVNLNKMSVATDIVTKYGTIPAKYTDPDNYPFVIFNNGEFYDAGTAIYDAFVDASGCIGRKIRNLEGEVVIVCRGDFKVGAANEMLTNHWKANVTLDLMGCTIDATEADHLFASTGTNSFNTNLTVKNGSIILKNGLVTLSNKQNDPGRTQSFTFENIDITTSYKELIVYNQIAIHGYANFTFIDCDIVSDNLTTNIYRAGKGASDTNNLMQVNMIVKGGSLTLSSFNQSVLVGEYNGGKVTFLPDTKGQMHKVILPAGTTVSDTAYKGENGATLYLVEHKASDKGDEYVMESLTTPYGVIPYEMSSHVDYPFLAFIDGSVMTIGEGKPYNLFDNIDVSGNFERTLRNKNTSGATVIARCDFTVSSDGHFKTNYQKAPLLIDLCGYTIDATAANNLFASNGTQAFDNVITVKNGRIILGKGLITVSINNNVTGKKQTFNFESLDITSKYKELLVYNQIYSAGNVYVNFSDCNIDSENLTSHVFRAGKGSSDTENLMKVYVTVKGGSLTLNSFDQSKFVQEYNEGSVTFLKDENGKYITVNILGATNEGYSKEYSNGVDVLLLKKADEKDGYGVYTMMIKSVSYTFFDFDGNVLGTVNAKDAEEALSKAPTLADKAINGAIKLTNTDWTLNGVSYTPKATAVATDAFINNGAFVNLSLKESFDIFFYVSEEFYDYLADDVKSGFTNSNYKVNGKTLYTTTPISRNANEAYTDANFSLTLVGEGYEVDVEYSVSIAAYLEASLEVSKDSDKQLCYYIAKYLNDAYAYFTKHDGEGKTTLSELVTEYIDFNNNMARPTINTDYSAFTGSIAIDLKSSPSYVINSSKNGTVEFAGKTYKLNANEELRISTSANNFGKVLTIRIDGVVSTYCLGNYVANIEAYDGASAELKALVGSFYNYILFASKR